MYFSMFLIGQSGVVCAVFRVQCMRTLILTEVQSVQGFMANGSEIFSKTFHLLVSFQRKK